MSKFDFEGRCEECGERVNILIDRLSTNSMKLTADECLDHPGKTEILWLQRDDINEQLEVVKPKEVGQINGLMTELEYYGNHDGNCDMACMQGGKCTCGFEQAMKGEPQYVCAGCEFKTSDKDVINEHLAKCKVPLNRYGG